jgi:cellulose synthase/poly-beta-1,6-N-acetylglucosamine synthase-like glycosyltransferase
MRPKRTRPAGSITWPSVTITVPVFNAVSDIRATLERVLRLDYPRERLQVLVLSDASTDGTDEVVREFEARGVQLLRAPTRRGKTAAENAAVSHAHGDIIVNIDASVVVPPASLKALVTVFEDPAIGLASGRDVSVGKASQVARGGESAYTGYEMWIRDLETAVGSIVGASGCFYAIRRCIHANPLPAALSWDFASALVARELGYRSVSVPEAVCIVPRTVYVRTELRRKTRTMARGLSTLFHQRALMNPARFGGFALMLISHKLLRWLPYLLLPMALLALGVLALETSAARILMVVVLAGLATGAIGLRYPNVKLPRAVVLAAFVLAVLTAGFLAWWEALRRAPTATWEPTPRPLPSIR